MVNLGAELRAVWPAGDQGRAAAEDLAEQAVGMSPVLRLAEADDPRDLLARSEAEEIGPGLRLGSISSGAVAGPDTLVIDPLISFGAGDHPSTRLNLRLLAEVLADPNAQPRTGWLADVGAGSGILGLAMALLSGRPVVALDPEGASARAVARNQALNPLAGRLVHFVRGTHRALFGSFGLVACNMPPAILLEAAEVLASGTAPHGRLVLSGFRAVDAAEVAGVFQAHGLTLAGRADEGDWAGLVMQNRL